MIQYH